MQIVYEGGSDFMCCSLSALFPSFCSSSHVLLLPVLVAYFREVYIHVLGTCELLLWMLKIGRYTDVMHSMFVYVIVNVTVFLSVCFCNFGRIPVIG